MLTRIDTSQVRLGMFVHALEGKWIDHPFWRSRFLLESEQEVAMIRASRITGIVIDLAKGIGLEDAADVSSELQASAACDTAAPISIRKAIRPPRADGMSTAPCMLDDEARRASEIIARSRKAMARLMGQARLGKALDPARVMPIVADIAGSTARNPAALVALSRFRSDDDFTYVHSVAVCALMVNLARRLGMGEDEVREAGIAGLLHDIGKSVVPDHILTKPSGLTDQERAVMRTHPARGLAILQASPGVPDAALDACRDHHEKVDGSGYPAGAKGADITLMGRMCAVCDVYDAITSRRPYKAPSTAADALAMMYRWEGHFDPVIMAAFVKSVGIYPVGSLVRLSSDMLALVIGQKESAPLRPLVRPFYSISGRCRMEMPDIDLSATDDNIVSREEPGAWGFLNWDQDWVRMIGQRPARRAA